MTVNTSLTGWTGLGKEGAFGSQTTPPVFVFAANAGSTGETGDAFMGKVSFYGTTAALTPPVGSWFIAGDGDPAWGGGIEQTVSGLNPGDTYAVSFYWAGAQQQGFSGATTEAWQVSFGSSVLSTTTVNTPSQSFDGWQPLTTLDFTASSASQVLSFLAVGSPSGLPPWLLLSDVTLTDITNQAVPEPATAGLILLGGLAAVPVVSRFRRKRAQ